MFDLHVLHAVGNGLKYYQDNEEKFKGLFSDVGETLRQAMYEKFKNTKIQTDVAYAGRTPQLPLVTCEINEQFYDRQGLGNLGANNTFHLFTSQEAVIHIYAKDIDTLRVFHRVIQASMLIFTPSFLRTGYQNILFTGSSTLTPEESLISEDLRVFTRQLRYAALHLLEVDSLETVTTYDKDKVLLNAEDVTTADDVKGGVVPS